MVHPVTSKITSLQGYYGIREFLSIHHASGVHITNIKTTVRPSRDEFVNTIIALLFGVVVLPTAIITAAVIAAVTQGEIPALSGGDKYDMLIQEANAEDVRKGKDVVGAKGAKAPEPKLDADLLRTLYGAKIGL